MSKTEWTAVGANSEAFWEPATAQVANYAGVDVVKVRETFEGGGRISLKLSEKQLNQCHLCGVAFVEQKAFRDGKRVPLRFFDGIQTREA